MLRFCTLWLQKQCSFKLVFCIFEIFQAEVDLAQQESGGELSGSEFEAGFEGIAGSGEVTGLLPSLTFIKSRDRISGFSRQLQMFSGPGVLSGVKFQFSQLS